MDIPHQKLSKTFTNVIYVGFMDKFKEVGVGGRVLERIRKW